LTEESVKLERGPGEDVKRDEVLQGGGKSGRQKPKPVKRAGGDGCRKTEKEAGVEVPLGEKGCPGRKQPGKVQVGF